MLFWMELPETSNAGSLHVDKWDFGLAGLSYKGHVILDKRYAHPPILDVDIK